MTILPPNPITVTSSTLLGDVHSTNTYVVRDNGFNGQIGDQTLLTYGDTLYKDSSYSDTFYGIVSNSVAQPTSNPLQVFDLLLNSQGWPEQFCPVNAAWGEDNTDYAIGISNVMETSPGNGILFFLKNYRPNGVNNIIGAGVATVTLDGDVPSCTRLAEYWWDASTEPWYGDICCVKFGTYIYAYGHGPSQVYIYCCRVLTSNATDLSAYEYWNGSSWQTERLYDVTATESVFWEIQSGQVIWSKYYGCLMFVYLDRFLDNQVNAVTARYPQGPWSSPVILYKCPAGTPAGSIYGALPQDNYDPTGKTLVCVYTQIPNDIRAIEVTFT
ncbi:hypothetical protein V1520DRAFT_12981 [Lipomyces starkeyi]|uniref:Uncharacterized protein n=1 Tax=Lipomyces starkeyi NRRL Y-11557 TaxID=675824 RepID=A0A1E3PVF8_LIPST|nr:hypothetical protein LIPSTDRAFT_198474 [Lipomyces starkeyi NRRL Y-11557]